MILPDAAEACPFTPLGMTLRALRDRRGMTQADLTRALNWPKNRLVSVERGAMDLSVRNLLDLVEAIEATTAEQDELIEAWSRSTCVFSFLPTNPAVAKAMGILAIHGHDLTPAALAEIIEVARPRRQGRTAS